ncbi:hypothetical protein [Streptomyces sp. NPDC016845]|uniref:hypothetical protein n=1 Tax=Streptomyces sp. NPDC016845 TaxID=3364972 RepID=UPI0037ADEC6B
MDIQNEAEVHWQPKKDEFGLRWVRQRRYGQTISGDFGFSVDLTDEDIVGWTLVPTDNPEVDFVPRVFYLLRGDEAEEAQSAKAWHRAPADAVLIETVSQGVAGEHPRLHMSS